jgi:ATP-binding cassette subfamily F protein uup
LQVLEDFLEGYPGCLVVVTHDRYFMDKLVEHVFVFEGQGKIKDFNGSYAEYRALKRSEEAEKRAAAPLAPVAQATKSASSLSNTERNELKKLEKEIAALEKKKAEIMDKFNTTGLDAAAASKLSTELGQVQDDLDLKEMRWLELAERA